MPISKRSIVVLLISMALASGSAAAQGRGGGGAHKTQPPKTTHPVKTTTTHAASPAPKTTTPKASPAPKAHGGASGAHSPKTMTPTTKAKTTTTTTASTKTASTKTATSAKTSNTTTRTTTTTAPPTTTVQLTPVQQKLQKNTNLASKLESRLPKGTDLMLAAEGFRNLGQFVAAVNVSNNLDIPFTKLKASMVDDGLSLGQSIQKLRPSADSTREATRAESQATVLLNSTTVTTSTATTTTTTSTSTSISKAKKNSGASQD